tara:strand:- start:446 stop:745 length:300 start_codon:yes stop_codon:yes gene_type:complete
MKIITAHEFEEAIKSNANVIIQFSADWCGPCKRMTPVLEKFSEARSDVNSFKVDVGNDNELAMQYEVKSIPMLAFFKDGELVKKTVGLIDANKLSDIIP